MKFGWPIKHGKPFLALNNTNCKLSNNVIAMSIGDIFLISRNQIMS